MRISSELSDDYGFSSGKLAKQQSVLKNQLESKNREVISASEASEMTSGEWFPAGTALVFPRFKTHGENQTHRLLHFPRPCYNSRPTHVGDEHPEKILPSQSGGFNSRSAMERITSPISAASTCILSDTASTPSFSLGAHPLPYLCSLQSAGMPWLVLGHAAQQLWSIHRYSRCLTHHWARVEALQVVYRGISICQQTI